MAGGSGSVILVRPETPVFRLECGKQYHSLCRKDRDVLVKEVVRKKEYESRPRSDEELV